MPTPRTPLEAAFGQRLDLDFDDIHTEDHYDAADDRDADQAARALALVG